MEARTRSAGVSPCLRVSDRRNPNPREFSGLSCDGPLTSPSTADFLVDQCGFQPN